MMEAVVFHRPSGFNAPGSGDPRAGGGGKACASEVKLWDGDAAGAAPSPFTTARAEKIRVGFDTAADVERLRAEGESI